MSIVARSGALALIALVSVHVTAPANAKLVWNDPSPSDLRGDGACTSSPLGRAERLAWRENFIVRRPSFPFVPFPSLVTPYGLLAPSFTTAWLWSDRPLAGFAPSCDGR